jgi:DNA gyrase subunit A
MSDTKNSEDIQKIPVEEKGITVSGIVDEMKSAYLDYAMSVIVSRALPDVRDGLKPVHRRILYMMHKQGFSSSARFVKSARVVGEVLGKLHPHGDAPVYEAMVRLAQDFSMRYPLVRGQGNFGSIDGDPPASMRYTEVKLSRLSEEMLADIEKNTVVMRDNFDATFQEPEYLPAKLPNLLLMGSEGIAVGMATKIPPHNLTEVLDALIFMIDKADIDKNRYKDFVKNKDLKNTQVADAYGIVPFDATARDQSSYLNYLITLDDLLQFVKGPDFPTSGVIYGANDIKQMYATGKMSIVVRGVADIEEMKGGKSAIIITELPYQVNKATLVERIAGMVIDKKIVGISDLRDESNREGIRIVIELKRDATPKQALNNLFKYTELQTSFPTNIVALVDGVPQTLGLQPILEHYLRHRVDIVIRRSEYEWRQAKMRAHILDGYIIALDNIDEIVETIKKSKDEPDAKEKLIKKFKLTEVQAKAILDMQLRRLTGLERDKIEKELSELDKIIKHLESIMKDVSKILTVIKDELVEIKKNYGDERKTKVVKSKPGELSDEMLIENKEVLVVMTKDGYIKQVAKDTFRSQHRGGQGVSGMETKDTDDILNICSAQTHDYVMYFTNTGRTFQTRVWDIPVGSRISKGKAIVNVITLRPDEKVTSILTFAPETAKNRTASLSTTDEDKYIIMVTKKGTVKKSEFAEYKNIRTNGLIAIKLETDDELKWVMLSNGNANVMLISTSGKAIMFDEKEVRAVGRASIGVKGMELEDDDYLASAEIINKSDMKKNLLVIGSRGIGKMTAISEFKGQHRGGKGVKIAATGDKFGRVSFVGLIGTENQDVVITSSEGTVVKISLKEIPSRSRTGKGVILMRIKSHQEEVVSATLI